MLFLHLIENCLLFQVQDKHNTSSFSHMSLDGVVSIQLQNYKKVVIISLVLANYYNLGHILEFKSSICLLLVGNPKAP